MSVWVHACVWVWMCVSVWNELVCGVIMFVLWECIDV